MADRFIQFSAASDAVPIEDRGFFDRVSDQVLTSAAVKTAAGLMRESETIFPTDPNYRWEENIPSGMENYYQQYATTRSNKEALALTHQIKFLNDTANRQSRDTPLQALGAGLVAQLADPLTYVPVPGLYGIGLVKGLGKGALTIGGLTAAGDYVGESFNPIATEESTRMLLASDVAFGAIFGAAFGGIVPRIVGPVASKLGFDKLGMKEGSLGENYMKAHSALDFGVAERISLDNLPYTVSDHAGAKVQIIRAAPGRTDTLPAGVRQIVPEITDPVFHGTPYHEKFQQFVDAEGNLVLLPSVNFDVQTGVSFGKTRDVAARYAGGDVNLRAYNPDVGMIFEIDRSALPKNIIDFSEEELFAPADPAVRDNIAELGGGVAEATTDELRPYATIIPAGKWRVAPATETSPFVAPTEYVGLRPEETVTIPAQEGTINMNGAELIMDYQNQPKGMFNSLNEWMNYNLNKALNEQAIPRIDGESDVAFADRIAKMSLDETRAGRVPLNPGGTFLDRMTLLGTMHASAADLFGDDNVLMNAWQQTIGDMTTNSVATQLGRPAVDSVFLRSERMKLQANLASSQSIHAAYASYMAGTEVAVNKYRNIITNFVANSWFIGNSKRNGKVDMPTFRSMVSVIAENPSNTHFNGIEIPQEVHIAAREHRKIYDYFEEKIRQYGMSDGARIVNEDIASLNRRISSVEDAIRRSPKRNVPSFEATLSGLQEELRVANLTKDNLKQTPLLPRGVDNYVNHVWRLDAVEARREEFTKKIAELFARGDSPVSDEIMPSLLGDKPDLAELAVRQDRAREITNGFYGKNAIQAAEWLRDNTKPEYVPVATKVVERLQMLERAGMRTSVTILEKGSPDLLGKATAHAEVKFGRTSGTTGGISITDPEVNVVYRGLTDDTTTKKMPPLSDEIALHELIHAAIHGSIKLAREGSTFETAPKLSQAYMELAQLRFRIVERHKKRVAKAKKGGLTLLPVEERFAKWNTLDNEDEFVAWGMTSREFQEYLEGIPSPSGLKTMFDDFVNAVRDLLGFPPGQETSLSKLIQITGDLLDVDATQLRALGNARRTRMVAEFPTEAEKAFQPDIAMPTSNQRPSAGTLNDRGDITQRVSEGDEAPLRSEFRGAEERAKKWVANLLGETSEDVLSPGGSAGGVMYISHRQINATFEEFGDFLETDIQLLMQHYTNKMVPAIEMHRMFGDRTMKRKMDELRTYLEIKYNDLPEKQRIKKIGDQIQLIEDARDRVLGTFGVSDASQWSLRGVRALKNLSTFNHMGSTVVAAATDPMKILQRAGMGNGLKYALAHFDAGSAGLAMSKGMAKLAGQAAEFANWSAAARFQHGDSLIRANGTLVERGLDRAVPIFFQMNGLTPWTIWMKEFTGGLMTHVLLDDMEKIAKATATGKPLDQKAMKRLLAAGINQRDAVIISKMPIEVYGPHKMKLANVQAWTGTEGQYAREKFLAALQSEIQSSVMTASPGDKARIFDGVIYKSKARYRVEKQISDLAKQREEVLEQIRAIRSDPSIPTERAPPVFVEPTPAEVPTAAAAPAAPAAPRQPSFLDAVLAENQAKIDAAAKTAGAVPVQPEAAPVKLAAPALDAPSTQKAGDIVPTKDEMIVPLLEQLSEIGQQSGMLKNSAARVGRGGSPLLGLPFQFMSFAVAAGPKLLGSMLNDRDRSRAMGALLMLSTGYLISRFWDNSSGKWDEMDADQKFYKAFDRSGLGGIITTMGATADTFDIGLEALAGWEDPYGPAKFSEKVGRIAGAGPGDVISFGQAVLDPDLTAHERASMIRRVTPGNNLFYMKGLFRAVSNALADYAEEDGTGISPAQIRGGSEPRPRKFE